MAINIPGFVVVVCILWYSVGVWRSTDKYFRDEYKKYLEKEYHKNQHLKANDHAALPPHPSVDKQKVINEDKSNKWEEDNVQPISLNNNDNEQLSSFRKCHSQNAPKKKEFDEQDWVEDNSPSISYREDAKLSKYGIERKNHPSKRTINDFDDEFCSLNNEKGTCGD